MNSKDISCIFASGKPARALKNTKAAMEILPDLQSFRPTGYHLSMLDWKDGRDRFRRMSGFCYTPCTLKNPEDLFSIKKITHHPGTRCKSGSAGRSLVADACRDITCCFPGNGQFIPGKTKHVHIGAGHTGYTQPPAVTDPLTPASTGQFIPGTPQKDPARQLSGGNASLCAGCLVTGSVFDAPVLCAGAVFDARV